MPNNRECTGHDWYCCHVEGRHCDYLCSRCGARKNTYRPPCEGLVRFVARVLGVTPTERGK